jgi:hypothetical protein
MRLSGTLLVVTIIASPAPGQAIQNLPSAPNPASAIRTDPTTAETWHVYASPPGISQTTESGWKDALEAIQVWQNRNVTFGNTFNGFIIDSFRYGAYAGPAPTGNAFPSWTDNGVTFDGNNDDAGGLEMGCFLNIPNPNPYMDVYWIQLVTTDDTTGTPTFFPYGRIINGYYFFIDNGQTANTVGNWKYVGGVGPTNQTTFGDLPRYPYSGLDLHGITGVHVNFYTTIAADDGSNLQIGANSINWTYELWR